MRKELRLRLLAALPLGLGVAALLMTFGARALGDHLVTEEMTVPAADPGIHLYLRSKRPAEMTTFRPERTLLFVSGSTYPAETSFDLPLGGQSWMEWIAARGFDVWFVELRGYGRSTRPPEMAQPPDANRPIVRTDTAVKDVASAVDAILARRGIEGLGLLGWSWGTTITASDTVEHPDKVVRLVLYGPRWVLTAPSPSTEPSKALGAYRTATTAKAREHWLKGAPEHEKATLIPPGWFEQWAAATWATDPEAAKSDPPALRAPNGTMADVRDYWSAGKPMYDPARISVPTLLVGAEWDIDTPPAMRQALLPLLKNAPSKRYVELGGGTHMIVMERNRLDLFRAVQTFLGETERP